MQYAADDHLIDITYNRKIQVITETMKTHDNNIIIDSVVVERNNWIFVSLEQYKLPQLSMHCVFTSVITRAHTSYLISAVRSTLTH